MSSFQPGFLTACIEKLPHEPYGKLAYVLCLPIRCDQPQQVHAMSMIKVTIRSYDIINAALPEDMRLDRIMGKPLLVELEQGARVIDIFKNLPWLADPIRDTVVVFINSQAETINSQLHDGDILDLMTPSGGG
jgi:hypothetical protein